tara:strand:+ start:220 stop:564 length:345 start_codon:yes stop_codon:yes gene_type:complete
MKNKISTLGYFVKRLKDNGFIVWKIFNKYNIGDHRKWTILINPEFQSVYITCFVNLEGLDDTPQFMFDDGNIFFKKNTLLKTNSIETVVQHLVDHNVGQNLKQFDNTVRNDEGA